MLSCFSWIVDGVIRLEQEYGFVNSQAFSDATDIEALLRFLKYRPSHSILLLGLRLAGQYLVSTRHTSLSSSEIRIQIALKVTLTLIRN